MRSQARNRSLDIWKYRYFSHGIRDKVPDIAATGAVFIGECPVGMPPSNVERMEVTLLELTPHRVCPRVPLICAVMGKFVPISGI
jgi:hypothetical protein